MAENITNPESGSESKFQQGSVHEAANSFFNLLGDDEAPQEGQAEAAPEGEEEFQGEEAPQEYSENDSEEDSNEEPDQEEPRMARIKVNGEELELSEDELINYAQQGVDYTKKTQQLAEQRKLLEQEAHSILEARQMRDAYAERLQVLAEVLSTQGQTEDLEALKENDPVGYAVAVAEQQQKDKQMAAVRAEQKRIAEEQQAEYAMQRQQYIAQQADVLSKALPEYADPEKGEKLRNDMRRFAKSVGFTDDELSNVVDSRHVMTLYKAMQYDKLQQAKPQVTKRVSEAPKTLKSGSGVKTTNTDVIKRNKQQLRATGKVKDAAKIWESFL
jgi:hypothetical protein